MRSAPAVRRTFGPAVLLAACSALSLASAVAAPAVPAAPAAPSNTTGVEPRTAGHLLFTGEAPLAGQIAGQQLALGATALRCINCHAAPGTRREALAATPPRGSLASPAASGVAGATLGPKIDADALLRLQPRRGGPPSRYELAAFCRVLRSGVDPAQVMVQRVMPRYQIGDADCAALWAYLSAPA